MSLKLHILKNISFVTVAELISNLLSYFLIIFIARQLGATDLGIYSFAFAFAGIFTFAYDFGISYFFIRKVSENRKHAKKYFGHYASLKLFFCLITMILPIIALLFLERGTTVNTIVILAASSLFFQNYSYVARNTYSAFQEFRYEAYVRVLERVLAFIFGLSVLYLGYGLLGFMIVLAFSSLTSSLYSFHLLKKLDVKFTLTIDTNAYKQMIKTGWLFWLSSVFIIIYFQIDTIMLSFMKGYEATGYYNAAYKLINVISKFPWIIVFVLFPVMSEAHSKMPKQVLKSILAKGMQVMVIVGFPLMVGTTLLAKDIIFFIYKENFEASIILLQILVWTSAFLFLSNILGWFFGSVGKSRIFTYTTGFCLVLNASLNYFLIPPLSSIGASIATVVTSCVNFILLYYFSIRENYAVSLRKTMLRPFLGSLAMGVCIFLLEPYIHFMMLIPIGVLVYFVSLLLLGDLREDLKEITQQFYLSQSKK